MTTLLNSSGLSPVAGGAFDAVGSDGDDKMREEESFGASKIRGGETREERTLHPWINHWIILPFQRRVLQSLSTCLIVVIALLWQKWKKCALWPN